MEWYYCVQGPPGTPFERGYYLGTVIFPPNYPFAPPAIRMITPSGRFEVGSRLCLSISDFHPESWNPIWGIETILVGLLAFMVGTDKTHGSITTTDEEKQEIASASREKLFDEISAEKFATNNAAKQVYLKPGALPDTVTIVFRKAEKQNA